MARKQPIPLADLAKQCTRFLAGDGPRTVASLLAQIPDDTVIDVYGFGGVVEELESEIAALFGKEAALFLPTGIMSQQTVLRVHADRRHLTTIAFHPLSHLRTHEENAFSRLHGLHEVLAGSRFTPVEPIRLETLEEIREPLAALLIELPQRDIGGYLPTWDELVSQVEWARARGAAVHLDGARIWEAAPYYAATAKKSLADIAELFDSIYVSFYKGLGGISGSCVLGDKDVIDEASLWRTRHGGRPYMLWPYAASALTVLRDRPRDMAAYYRRALALAKRLRTIEGIDILPDEVRSPLMHLRFAETVDVMESRVREIATRERIWTFLRPFISEGTHLQRYEYQVGRASMELSLDEMVAVFRELAGVKKTRSQ
jgi:threonine aldolase